MTSAPQAQLSASVTRILSLSNFPPELKTRDLIAAFGEWEADQGGFKIKWIDDQNALVVFNDAGVAKKAYLQTLLRPHLSLTSFAVIRPYDGPDAQSIIANVNARTHGARAQSISNINAFSPPQTQTQPYPLTHSSSSSSTLPTSSHPPLSSSSHHHHHRSNSHSHHSRMGSFGATSTTSGSWGRAAEGVHQRRESSAGPGGNRRDSAGGADAALGEIRRAMQQAGGLGGTTGGQSLSGRVGGRTASMSHTSSSNTTMDGGLGATA